ncbi:MAG TPA: type 1 glutamine amidotransferase domain-containing protein [Dehalococcoidia bacterium]|nr:type 1 glutamine amidotransferase domain-containing protein [Dehalococcoidia bacterium]
MNKQQKILIVLTSHDTLGESGQPTGYWLSELTHFHHVVTEAGYEADFVSPAGGEAPVDPISLKLNDPINKGFMESPELVFKIKNTLTPEKVNAADYLAIYYVGGHGPMWDIATHDKIADIAKVIYENHGVVSAVCHGSAGLLNIRLSSGKLLLEGKKVTGFCNLEERLVRKNRWVPFSLEAELKKKAAAYTKKLPTLENVEVSERLVTGQNPKSARAVAEKVVTLLGQGDHQKTL